MAFIRTRTRGNLVVYQLVKSVRHGKKVLQTVLKDFGSRADAAAFAKENGLKLPEERLIDAPLAERITGKLKQLNSMRPLPKATLEGLGKKFEVEMTYNSNAIEGNHLSFKETFLVLEKGMAIGGRTVKEHLEATNHRDALAFLEKLANQKNPVTEMDLLNLHKLIADKNLSPLESGFYRRERVYMTESVHMPPSPKEVPVLMKEVLGLLNRKEEENDEIKTVEAAARLHHRLVFIHPFTDGNGRLARLLTNLKLMRAGFPPIILRKAERKSYYDALEKADKGNMQPFTTMIARDVERALDLYLGAAAPS